MQFLKRLIVLVALSLFVSSCMDVATTSAQAIYNRHSLQKNLTDQIITLKIYRGFDRQNPAFRDTNITVATLNREVLLAGQVPHQWQKDLADKVAREVPNVKRVFNYIHVSNPSSPLTRVSDAWITGKIKSRLLMSEDLDATQIKVVTENGQVFLMGMLFRDEANTAMDIAKHTYGVQNVVKMFSILEVVPS